MERFLSEFRYIFVAYTPEFYSKQTVHTVFSSARREIRPTRLLPRLGIGTGTAHKSDSPSSSSESFDFPMSHASLLTEWCVIGEMSSEKTIHED